MRHGTSSRSRTDCEVAYVAVLTVELDSECRERRDEEHRVRSDVLAPRQGIVSLHVTWLEGLDCDLLHTWIYFSTSKDQRLRHWQFVTTWLVLSCATWLLLN